jgi:hypothetical protein
MPMENSRFRPMGGLNSRGPRVKFFKGWFEETLPGHSVPDHDVMVVNFDAACLESPDANINPGAT